MSSTQIRIWFCILILSGVAAYYFFITLPKQREGEAQQQSAAILKPVIRADPRFSDIEIHQTESGPFFFLTGKVRSAAELDALTKLIKDTPLPRKPDIDVRAPEKSK